MISFLSKQLSRDPAPRVLSLLQHHSSKASIRQLSAFFMIQLSHLYTTTGIDHMDLAGKVMSLILGLRCIHFPVFHKEKLRPKGVLLPKVLQAGSGLGSAGANQSPRFTACQLQCHLGGPGASWIKPVMASSVLIRHRLITLLQGYVSAEMQQIKQTWVTHVLESESHPGDSLPWESEPALEVETQISGLHQ